MTPKRDIKTGRWLKGRVKPIKLCLYCGKFERRNDRKYCSMRCMGLDRRGKPTWIKGKKTGIIPRTAFKKGQTAWNKGKHNTNCMGEKSYFWKGGITKLGFSIRSSIEYEKWRNDVFQRDNFICQMCGEKGSGNLIAHHKKDFAIILKENNIKSIDDAVKCKELWEINNGLTLHEECHRLTDNFPRNLRYAIVRSA